MDITTELLLGVLCEQEPVKISLTSITFDHPV